MNRAYYKNTIAGFCEDDPNEIRGAMVAAHHFSLLETQRYAWTEQTLLLQSILQGVDGHIYFEFSIPRMGKRIDVLLIINGVIFVVEFKVGAKSYLAADFDQVTDYALDLHNFHEGSHDAWIAPILVATEFDDVADTVITQAKDKFFSPISCNGPQLQQVISRVLALTSAHPKTFN